MRCVTALPAECKSHVKEAIEKSAQQGRGSSEN